MLAMVSMVNIPYTSFISNDDLRTNTEVIQYRPVWLQSNMDSSLHTCFMSTSGWYPFTCYKHCWVVLTSSTYLLSSSFSKYVVKLRAQSFTNWRVCFILPELKVGVITERTAFHIPPFSPRSIWSITGSLNVTKLSMRSGCKKVEWWWYWVKMELSET